MRVRSYEEADESGVIALWRECDLVRPWNDPQKDIQRKLKVWPEGFRVAEADGRIVGTIMVGYEGHRGWINYLAVSPNCRKRGLGRQLMNEAERLLKARGCPKINLQVRVTNSAAVAFYKRLGFRPDEVVSFGKRLIEDDPRPATATETKS